MSGSPRMHRLFAPDGRCLIIALDHGIFNEPSFLTGMEDIAHAVGRTAKFAPDAIQLAPGQARILQSIPGPRKPTLVLRVDTSNVYTKPVATSLFAVLIEQAVEQALALDAAAIVVNLLSVPGQEALHATCLRHIAQLRAQCERYRMPLMVEPLALLPAPSGRVLESSLNAHTIATLTRQAVEMGADLIKADSCEDVADFAQVVEAASGKPVLVRGGEAVNADVLLARTASLLQRGAQGLVFGRNILQSSQPDLLVAALLALLHGQASAEQAQASMHRAAAVPPPVPPPVPAVAGPA